MRKPNSTEYIICPNSRFKSKKPPKSVFDTFTPDGTKISFGVIDSHKHGYMAIRECDWTDLAVPLEAGEQFII